MTLELRILTLLIVLFDLDCASLPRHHWSLFAIDQCFAPIVSHFESLVAPSHHSIALIGYRYPESVQDLLSNDDSLHSMG